MPLPRRLVLALGALLLPSCRRHPGRREAPDTAPAASPEASAAPPASSAAPAASAPPAASAAAVLPPGRWAGFEREADALLAGAIKRAEVPGAVVLVSHQGEVALHKAYGLRSVEPQPEAMTADTIFDLASLTKPIATATLVHWLAAQGRLPLRRALSAFFPELAGTPLGAATPEHLLLHTAGLDSDLPAGSLRGGIASALDALKERPLIAPPGQKFRYSDTGYQLLGELVSRLGGAPLGALFARVIAGPLGTPTLTFALPPDLRPRAAPTERRGERWLRGEAHDPSVAALGGAAGHAGLFGTAADLDAFARLLLASGRHQDHPVLDPPVVAALLAHHPVPRGTRTLGWDVDSGMLTSRGEALPPRGFGHLGFTGTSLWVDPPTRTSIVLLTSRLHPRGKGNANPTRRELSTVAGRRVMSEVRCGLDALVASPDRLRGQRVGLLTHAAATTVGGIRSVDALRAAGVEVVALFSPEHGLESKQDARVGDARDEATGLPIHSLYGDRRRPTPEQLAGLDALLIDLQDAGCRFYTYLSTLGYALEEASARALPVLVLDRPNPLGGLAVEGPLQDEKRTSFVAYHRLPVRHGMTLGELARLLVRERALPVPLDVVPLSGWRRAMLWEDTGLPWRNPSPNLRNPRAALLYPGVGLLEMTNLSVGRGTDRPFEQLGAPWLDSAALTRALMPPAIPGLRCAPTEFTPTSGPFASTRCRGVSFALTDPVAFSPLALAAALATSLLRLHRADWQPAQVDTLLLHQPSLAALLAGHDAAALRERWRSDQAPFLARREPFLLYP